jgi:uncharacterized protein (TIGR03067 family)
MRGFILGVLYLAVAGVAVAQTPNAESKKTAVAALETFADVWEIVTVQPVGAAKAARRLVFNNDGIYAAHDNGGTELWAGTFEIDPTASPKVWDHRSHDAKKEDKDLLGLYELVGDTLKVASVIGQWKDKKWVGRPRPMGFDTEQADVIIELKRVKSNRDGIRLNIRKGGTTMIEQLSGTAADYVRTTNRNDPDGFIALFNENAVVDDAGRIIRGRDAIRGWAASNIFAAKVTLEVLEAGGTDSDTTITAKVDGTFDRTGLPDPLIMTFQIVTVGGRIAQVTCRLAGR